MSDSSSIEWTNATWNPVTGCDWVTAGGESGPRHRPLNLDHALRIRDHALTQGVPFFFKQIGGTRPSSGGRLLDGHTWNQMPVHRQATIAGSNA